MKISAVYIAKNEAHNIARSLDSIKDAVDELILVDTGSTDNTVEIFQSYGGKVYHQPWRDDFSAPRNLALSKASGDWIVLLDADENFSPETAANIPAVLQQISDSTQGILINLVNYDKDTQEKQDSFYALRIVRNVPGLCYKGRIHEAIAQELKLQPVDKEILSVIHTGYSRSISKTKAQRNLEIMNSEIKAGRPECELYTYLHEAYKGLGDTAKALHYAKLDIDRGRQPISYASRSYRFILSYYSKYKGREKLLERLHYAELSVAAFPELPEFHAEYAEALCQWYRYYEAAGEYAKAIECLTDYRGLEPSLMPKEAMTALQNKLQKTKKLASKAEELSISACLIEKNEIENIEDWLQSSEAFADEIIVVDTGSEDGTDDIVKKSRAKLSYMEWQNDFALAKNEALSKATRDWIVFCDTDEIFYNPQSVRGFLADIELHHPEVVAILVPMANVDRDFDYKEFHRFNSLRIFRNREDIRYRGHVHEAIFVGDLPVMQTGKVFLTDDRLLIRHTGYSFSAGKKKENRNNSILLADQEKYGVNRGNYRYFAEGFAGAGDKKKALHYALLSIEAGVTAKGQEGDMNWLAYCCMDELGYGTEEKLAVIEDGLSEVPHIPDFYGAKGFVLAEEGRFREASSLLSKAIDMFWQAQDEGVQPTSSYFRGVLIKAYYTMGTCAGKMGDMDLALSYFKAALEFNLFAEDAIVALCDTFRGEPHPRLVGLIEELLQRKAEWRRIFLNILERNGFIKLYQYLKQESKDSFIGKAYELYENNDIEALQTVCEKQLATDIQWLFVAVLGSKGDFRDVFYLNQLELLPQGLQNLARSYHGDEKRDFDINDYLAVLPAVITLGTQDMLTRFLELVAEEDSSVRVKVAEKLCQHEKWTEAHSIASEEIQQGLVPAYEEYIKWQQEAIDL